MNCKKKVLLMCSLASISAIWNGRCAAQDQTAPVQPQTADSAAAPASKDYDNSLGLPALRNFVDDQKAIWTSPFHMKPADADWLLPVGALAGGLFATDTEFEKHLSNSPNHLKYSKDFGNAGLGTFVGVGAGLYVWGRVTHNEHKRETGFLAGEAAVDSLAATYALKYAFQRERPLTDNYRGGFWQGGDSFPSEHAAAAWAIAGVVAHEYPGPLTSILAYGLAAGVSGSRLTAKQHFPSDVLIGSALGWFVSQEVYRHHHDPDLGGGSWPTYAEWREEAASTLGHGGSPYVELDSWIYPAIERLAAMGYIHSEFLGVRPWTRDECAELVDEAGDAIRSDDNAAAAADQLYDALEAEFRSNLESLGVSGESAARVESIYSRSMYISGPPLSDSYHFGQTITNDYGRPYQEGFNTYDGFSAYGTAGRFTVYVRGEYQHAPGAPAYPLAVRQVIANADENPLLPATPIAQTDQFRLLDSYFSTNYGGWDFSFGKQSMWWGPEYGSALMLSDNAEPMYMFRVHPEQQFEIPLLSRALGPVKTEFFVGKLSGNEFPARPVLHGEKISFRPTANIEFGFSRLVEFGGVGRPLTLGAIWNSYTSLKSSFYYRDAANPGKRTSNFEFSYRPPLVTHWLTLYADTIAMDDVVPLESPPRSAWNSGVYMPRLFGNSHLELRLEGGYTDPVTPRSNFGRFVYWEIFYHDLSTNKNNLIGSWMGREGQGFQGWATYHLGARSSVQVSYRHAKVSKDFIPNGETLNDGSTAVDWWVRRDVELSGSVQYEKWLAPILAPGPQTNWTSTLQITFYPAALH
jgi:membrane-associated phospholipid phosphatase